MEDNTIGMFMDVKLDIRERKLEFSHMKSWSRYFVRVEAVKCFPCYMRISFFSSPTDLATDLIVRINIPGLTVQMATSRTKQHSYGLFWKNNRKRCCAYFALETQLLCERHLRWMKKSIRNLELYRQEMMQLRRASRTPLYEIRQEMQPLDPLGAVPSPVTWDDMGIYQNLDNTQNIMGLQDILGPLPSVPPVTERGDTNGTNERAANSSRRVSGMSGIYEEIRDNSAAISSRLSRVSIASGIYEEMRLVVNAKDSACGSENPDENTAGSSPPPPLPPRPRSNTNEDFDLQRSFTTPEVDLMKKKRHWLRLDAMFGRRHTTSTDSQGSGTSKKRCSSTKDGKGRAKLSSGEKTPGLVVAVKDAPTAVVHRDKVSRLRLAENKRNSFSSPDLSRLKMDESRADLRDGRMCDESFENLSDGNCSGTSEFYPQQHDIDYIEEDFASSEFINMSTTSSLGAATPSGEFERRPEDEELLDPLRDFRRLNISERILEGFNGSMNSSTVNLVGAGCNASTIKEPNETENVQVGLNASTAPLSEADMVGYLEMGPAGTGFNRQKLEEVIYRNQPPRNGAKFAVELEPKASEESIYMTMDGTGKLPEPIRSSSTSSSSSSSSSSGVSSASDHSSLTDGSTKHRNSIDDKIPSYYPNEDFIRTPNRKPTDGKRSPGQVGDKLGSPFSTPVAATLPRTIKSAQPGPAETAAEIHDRIQATFRTPKATGRRPCPRTFLQIPESQPTAAEPSSPVTAGSREPSPKLYQKYATLARISSPGKYCAKSKPSADREGSPLNDAPPPTITTTPVGSGSRRFGSLPRFGKIDLSPLRMKINSVLQRHNSGNL